MPRNIPFTAPINQPTPQIEPALPSVAPLSGERTLDGSSRTVETDASQSHPDSVSGKRLGIVVSAGASRHLVDYVKRRFEELGAHTALVVPSNSARCFDDRTEIDAQHTLQDTPSTEFDFVVVLPGLESAATVSQEITNWALPLRNQTKPIAIGAQAAERLGLAIDNAAVFDVSTCEAFVQVCKNANSEAASLAR